MPPWAQAGGTLGFAGHAQYADQVAAELGLWYEIKGPSKPPASAIP